MDAIKSLLEDNFIFLFIIFAALIVCGQYRNKTPFWSEKTPQKTEENQTKETSRKWEGNWPDETSRKKEENQSEEIPRKWDETSRSFIPINKTPEPQPQTRQEFYKKELVFKRFLVKDFLAKLYTEGYASDFNHELINEIQINASDEKKLMAIIQDAYNKGYEDGYQHGYTVGDS